MMLTAAALAATVSLPTLAAADGDYCLIPRLSPDQPTLVSVADINYKFCGVAVIDGKHVRLDEVMKASDSHTSCDRRSCSKVLRYFEDADKKTAPYILIFEAPPRDESA